MQAAQPFALYDPADVIELVMDTADLDAIPVFLASAVNTFSFFTLFVVDFSGGKKGMHSVRPI